MGKDNSKDHEGAQPNASDCHGLMPGHWPVHPESDGSCDMDLLWPGAESYRPVSGLLAS